MTLKSGYPPSGNVKSGAVLAGVFSSRRDTSNSKLKVDLVSHLSAVSRDRQNQSATHDANHEPVALGPRSSGGIALLARSAARESAHP